MSKVHQRSINEIKNLQCRRAYQDSFTPDLEDNFRGSIDRFCEIAHAFLKSQSVLYSGSGYELLVALLKLLGHEVYAVSIFDHNSDPIYLNHRIPFRFCNIAADTLQFGSESIDSVRC